MTISSFGVLAIVAIAAIVTFGNKINLIIISE